MPPSKPLYGGLRGSLIGAIIASTVALVTTVLLLEDPLVEERELYRIQHMLRRQATEIESALARGDSPEHIRTRLEQPGRLGIDIRRHAKAKQSWSVDPLALPRGFSMRSDPRSSERFLQFHLRTGNGWHLYLVHSLASIERIRGAMRELLLVGGVVAALLSALLMWVLSRTMVSPIKDLTKAARALARGDLSVRTQSRRRDELGKLGRALDRMADQLDERLRTLRAGEARLRTVLNAMVEAVFVTGADRRIILSNQALVTLLGADPVGQSVLTAMRSSALHKAIRAARKGKRVAVQLSLETNGGPRSLSAHLAPLPERSGVVGVLHDITELMHADAVRRDFVANASHELRTPLTAIRGAVETLLDGAASDKETTERFLRLCLRHSLRLQRLVDDLLSLSKAESPEQRFDLGAVQVDKVVQEVLSQLETQAHGKHIHLEWEGERAQALGHARALDELIYNLVDNAIKYTPAGGRVRLRAQQDLNRVHLEVKDTGPGIPAQHIERIFERFYRVDTGRSREVGGTGLGLSIVKHLASRMRAAVSVESEVGKGTTFRVSMRRPLAALRRTAPDDKISDVSERQHEPASAEVKQTAGGHAAGRALSGEEKLALQRDMAEIVAQSALFKSLDGAERSALLTRGAVANFAPGQTLIQEGENGDTMYLLLSGNVRVHASADTGHDVSLAELGRAACIGEVSVLTGSARTATVEALTEVDAVVFQRSDVLALAEEHAAVRALLQALVEGRARDTVEKIVDAS